MQASAHKCDVAMLAVVLSAMSCASCNTGHASADEDDAPAQPGPRRRATRASAAAAAPDTGMWSLLTVVLSIWRSSTIPKHGVVMLGDTQVSSLSGSMALE